MDQFILQVLTTVAHFRSGINSRPLYKVYIAVFVCFVVQAVHIKIVSDLTSDSFTACLKRFILRRGKPKTISSDNASTFIRAERELNETFEMLKGGITRGQFILYFRENLMEIYSTSSLKSLKKHLRKMMGSI